MIALDTDHISLLQHPESTEGQILEYRLAASVDRDIVTTVVTLEEQMRAWLSVIARHRDVRQQSAYYDKLMDFVRFFASWRVLPFQDSAVQAYQELQQLHVRIATTDLKIGAIALANDATLLSRNVRDFMRVPGLRIEDWTKF
jgi:tRNA(fMet)-specific endonuclease VapC